MAEEKRQSSKSGETSDPEKGKGRGRATDTLVAATDPLTERMVEEFVEPLLDFMERVDPLTYAQAYYMWERSENILRTVMSGLIVGLEGFAHMIPMPRGVRDLGEKMAEHIPAAFDRVFMKRKTPAKPAEYTEASIIEAPRLFARILLRKRPGEPLPIRIPDLPEIFDLRLAKERLLLQQLHPVCSMESERLPALIKLIDGCPPDQARPCGRFLRRLQPEDLNRLSRLDQESFNAIVARFAQGRGWRELLRDLRDLAGRGAPRLIHRVASAHASRWAALGREEPVRRQRTRTIYWIGTGVIAVAIVTVIITWALS